MTLLLAATAILLLCGLLALATSRRPVWSVRVGVGGMVLAGPLGLAGALSALAAGTSQSVSLPWDVPIGSLAFGIDPLSAWFLLPLFGLSPLAAIYAGRYVGGAKGTAPRAIGAHFFWLTLLTAAMVVVLLARDAVLFLVAWELVSLAPFFLITLDDSDARVRSAGLTYLVAAHVGAVFLLPMFMMLGDAGGSLDFSSFAAASREPGRASALFVLAVLGFGTKAGFMPLHVWLPEAHPVAPSHVSALMSALVIKMGVYGLLRTLTFLGPPPASWGGLLIAVGLVSGLLGGLLAVAQGDLKRLLAYSSVENMGIVTTGIGVGLLGVHVGSALLAVLGIGGALLHVLNHALFKGMLFLAAGAVVHEAGTGAIDRLGGLLRRMPWTGAVFAAGTVAIVGLPPFNGFVSELMVYLAAGNATLSERPEVAAVGAVVLAGLALVGGLAAVAFIKAFGVVFLGEPRSAGARDAHEAPSAMVAPMALLAATCLAVALAAPWVVGALAGAVAVTTGIGAETAALHLSAPSAPLTTIAVLSMTLIGLVLLLHLGRKALLRGRSVRESVTWDCGYARPTESMQYTGSSFAQPLTSLSRAALRTQRDLQAPTGLFPRSGSLVTSTPDPVDVHVLEPLLRALRLALGAARRVEGANLHVYVLTIVLTLVGLLAWKLG